MGRRVIHERLDPKCQLLTVPDNDQHTYRLAAVIEGKVDTACCGAVGSEVSAIDQAPKVKDTSEPADPLTSLMICMTQHVIGRRK